MLEHAVYISRSILRVHWSTPVFCDSLLEEQPQARVTVTCLLWQSKKRLELSESGNYGGLHGAL